MNLQKKAIEKLGRDIPLSVDRKGTDLNPSPDATRLLMLQSINPVYPIHPC